MTNQCTKGDFQDVKIGSEENEFKKKEFKKKELNKKEIKKRRWKQRKGDGDHETREG